MKDLCSKYFVTTKVMTTSRSENVILLRLPHFQYMALMTIKFPSPEPIEQLNEYRDLCHLNSARKIETPYMFVLYTLYKIRAGRSFLSFTKR